jgi:hypothetical protein
MTDANRKLNDRIRMMTTDQLKEVSIRLTLASTAEEIIVCNRAERELQNRLPEKEFIAHMDILEAMLDNA